MNVVNELWQNIRFLKFYGWGTQTVLSPHAIQISCLTP